MKTTLRIFIIIIGALCAAPLLHAQHQCQTVFQVDTAQTDPNWQIYVHHIQVMRPVDKNISSYIIVTQRVGGEGAVDESTVGSKFCLRYSPASAKLENIGLSYSTGEINLDSYDYYFLNKGVPWQIDAAYDTSRKISASIFDSTTVNTLTPYNHTDDVSSAINLIPSFGNVACGLKSLVSVDEGTSTDYTFQTIYFHPTDGTILFALISTGLARSNSDTCPGNPNAWPIIKHTTTTPDYFFINADNPSIIMLGTTDTLWQTHDGGITWNNAALVHAGAIVYDAVHKTFLAATSDTKRGGFYLSTDDGVSFSTRVFSAPVFSLDADPATGNVYAGSRGAILLSRDGGKTFTLFDSVNATRNIVGVAAIGGKIIYADTMGVYQTDAPSVVQTVFIPGGEESIQNYPNPFAAVTTVTVKTSEPLSSLKYYDVLGREVFDAHVELQCDRRSFPFDGSLLPAGLYYCIAKTGTTVLQQQLRLIK